MISEADIAALEDRRFVALAQSDAATLADLLDDGVVYVHSNGLVETKAAFLAAMTSGARRYRSARLIGREIRLWGGTAVSAGDVDIEVDADGRALRLPLRYIAVYAEAAGWRMIAWQSMRMER